MARETRTSIKKTLCPKKPVPVPLPSISKIFAAFNAGLGVRKKDWSYGYYVYLNDSGDIMGGNLKDACRDDKSPAKDITFGNDATIWEVVDKAYSDAFHTKARAVALREASSTAFALATDAQVNAIAKVLKVSVAPNPCA